MKTSTWNDRLDASGQAAANRRLGWILIGIFMLLAAFSVGLILVRARARTANPHSISRGINVSGAAQGPV
jgi:hypothetical protein